jgi:hypothetical protein
VRERRNRIAPRSHDTLKHDHIHGLQHGQYGVGGNPLGVVEKAGADFASGVVDVGVEYAGETPHLRRD